MVRTIVMTRLGRYLSRSWRVVLIMAPVLRRWITALVGGDVLVLFLFAAIGRASHGESIDLIGTGTTALPFIGGETS